MKRRLDLTNSRPTKRRKVAKHHLSDGPLGIVISFLPQNDYANWLCTHKNAKRFKFGGKRVVIYWGMQPNYTDPWWFHKLSEATFEFPTLSIPNNAGRGWDSLHLDQLRDMRRLPSTMLPPCRELRVTQAETRWNLFLHSTTRRLTVDHTSWCLFNWLSFENLEYFELIDTNVASVENMMMQWPQAEPKLTHLVVRFAEPVCLYTIYIGIVSVRVYDIYAPKGSIVNTSRVRHFGSPASVNVHFL